MKPLDSVFFDTNVFIQTLKCPTEVENIKKFLTGAYLYVVNKIVLMELWSDAKNSIESKIIKIHQTSFPLVGLSDERFIEAGQIMAKMSQLYHFEPANRRQITWDILIALSARDNNSAVITYNHKDFKKIQKFVDFEFFGLL